MDWTLDTWVLHKAAGGDWDAAVLLGNILHKHHGVALDHENQIKTQYENCARETGHKLIRKWVQEVILKLAHWRSGKLTLSHQRALQNLKFDKGDWVFVAVASRTQSKLLVAEESDYTSKVKEYLLAQMSVSVLTVADSLKRFG